MLSFIKNFKQMIPKQFHVIILAFLCVLAVIVRMRSGMDVIDVLVAMLPIALIIFAIYVIETNRMTLVSHLVLFLLVFSDYLGTFIRTIFSYNFNSNTFTASFSWQLILGLIACIYLILMILSYFMSEGIKLKYSKSHVLFPMIIVFIYLYIRFGMGTATISLIPIVIVFLVNIPLAVVALLLSLVISTPFQMLNMFITGTARFTSLFFWLISLLAFYSIYLLVREALKLVHSKEQDSSIATEENKEE